MKLLLAEDDLITRKRLIRILEELGYDVEDYENGAEAWEVIEKQAGSDEEQTELMIIDWMMPEMSGPELCHKIRKLNAEPYRYLILLTSRNETHDIVQGMESGADDYITKPFDIEELRVRLRAAERIITLNKELLATRKKLEIQATHDSLTQLYNRAKVLLELEREITRSAREVSPLGVLMIDIDHFKDINDTFGHLSGDDALKKIAAILSDELRTYDTIGRYGGEEFLVLLPGCDKTTLLQLSERLRKAVEKNLIPTRTGSIPVTISIGATVMLPNEKLINAEELIAFADTALYQAKEEGRNRTVFHANGQE